MGPGGQGKSAGGPIRATRRLDRSGNDLRSSTGDDLGGPKGAKGPRGGKGEHLGSPKGSSGTSGRFHGANGDFCWVH